MTAAQVATVVERATGTAEIAPDPGGVAPSKAAGPVKVSAADGSTLSVGLPASDATNGVTSSQGTVVYPHAAGSTSLAVQPLADGGVRALVVVEDASAPADYRFGLDLPSGSVVRQQDDGSAVIVRNGETLGKFEAPWAVDARGRSVPTRYRFEHGALVQTVDFDAGTAFPVVADPSWKGVKKRAKAALKNSNTSTVAGAVGGCVAGAIAGVIGCGPGAATGAVGGFLKGAIEGAVKGH
ncbi:hypothetical protein OG478_12590 [Streptomyces phaeochromogenes]|uniref:hypothetical protein n=1 Tax=Streptomyces phaeochromogenes TaxID=1923 RepID=UPI00386BEDE8|nr:hypothetical protein OG478_12590 [Streptomyces phaeochromogenes]